MQKRQYCTWGTVFLPVPSEGRTAQGMDCEDLSEKYPRLHKTPVSVVPTSMEGNVKILFRSCKICVDYYYYKACEKRAIESRQPCCKVRGRSRDGG